MPKATRPNVDHLAEIASLRRRLQETEDVLAAIGRGEVDAFVVAGSEGEIIFTLEGADYLYRRMVETMQEGAATLSADGTILYANACLSAMLQVPLEGLVGQRFRHHVDAADRALYLSLLENAARRGVAGGGEISLRTGQGDALTAQVSFGTNSPARESVITLVVTDITPRKQAEDALKEREFFFRESQRLAAIGSYKADLSADRWESSEVLDGIFGIGPDYRRTIQGWLDLVHPDDRQMMKNYLEGEVVGQGRPFAREYRVIRPNDGELRWVNGLGALEPTPDGDGLLLMGTIQDITEEKKRDEERGRLEEQLQQAQKMESIGLLAGGVAHDFNNMLSVILGQVELAQKLESGPDLRRHLEQVRGAAQRSADIVRQLLAFARKQAMRPEALDLNAVISNALKMFRRLIGENIELTWLPGEDVWRLWIDPVQVDQILANLIVNARDAIEGSGSITIETCNRICDAAFCAEHVGLAPGDYVVLAVQDDGGGMPPDILDKIFEPFFTTKALGKGSGLGLSTVYGIVKQNGGYIAVHSEPGHGTRFQVFLPRYLGEVGQARQQEPMTGHEKGWETVLLVEDEPAVLDVGKQFLEMQGYRVLTAGTPQEALDLVKGYHGEIHLLVTDVIMPGMNGLELSRQILSFHPGLRHLFMSGYTADIIAENGGIGPGHNFIAKPFTFEALTAKVREVLDSGRD